MHELWVKVYCFCTQGSNAFSAYCWKAYTFPTELAWNTVKNELTVYTCGTISGQAIESPWPKCVLLHYADHCSLIRCPDSSRVTSPRSAFSNHVWLSWGFHMSIYTLESARDSLQTSLLEFSLGSHRSHSGWLGQDWQLNTSLWAMNRLCLSPTYSLISVNDVSVFYVEQVYTFMQIYS